MAYLDIKETSSNPQEAAAIYHRYFIRECLSVTIIGTLMAAIMYALVSLMGSIVIGAAEEKTTSSYVTKPATVDNTALISFYFLVVLCSLTLLGYLIYQSCRLLAIHKRIVTLESVAISNLDE